MKWRCALCLVVFRSGAAPDYGNGPYRCEAGCGLVYRELSDTANRIHLFAEPSKLPAGVKKLELPSN